MSFNTKTDLIPQSTDVNDYFKEEVPERWNFNDFFTENSHMSFNSAKHQYSTDLLKMKNNKSLGQKIADITSRKLKEPIKGNKGKSIEKGTTINKTLNIRDNTIQEINITDGNTIKNVNIAKKRDKQLKRKHEDDEESSVEDVDDYDGVINESSSQVEDDGIIQDPCNLSFSPPDKNDRFVVNETDVSLHFYEFQKLVKNQNDKLYLESHIHHALAISHILLLKHGQHHDDMINIFGDNQLELIISHLNNKFEIKKPSLSFDIITQLATIIEDVKNKKISRSKAIAKLLLLEDEVSKNQFKFIKSLTELLKKIPNVTILEETKEIELCTRYADPMLSGLFDDPEEDIFFRWTDQTTLETKKGYSLSRRRPDICITSLNGPNWKSNYGFGEAKACSENTNHYSLCKDLLRVGLFSKNSIDSGMMNAVLGIQVVGRSVTFYLSSLLSDGFYVMLELARISIPGCIDDLLKYLMDMNTIIMILDVFEKNCQVLPADQVSLHKKRSRPTPTTPTINRLISNASNRKRSCVLKYYYN